jgi:hypothetical protein
MDMSDIRTFTDRPVIGIIGISAFDCFVVQIDFDQHKLRFLWADDQQHPEWGKAMPMQLSQRYGPAVLMSMDGHDELFTIDTGSNSLLDLPSDAFDHLRNKTKQKVTSNPSYIGVGTVTLRQMRVPEIELGGAHYQDSVITETKHDGGQLGLLFLEHYLVTLDFANHRVYLKPGKEIDRKAEPDMSGLSVGRRELHTVALLVEEGSPAYQAGIRKDDILIELNGRSANDYDLYDLRDLLRSAEGREITLTFRRGGTQQTVKFKLHRWSI